MCTFLCMHGHVMLILPASPSRTCYGAYRTRVVAVLQERESLERQWEQRLAEAQQLAAGADAALHGALETRVAGLAGAVAALAAREHRLHKRKGASSLASHYRVVMQLHHMASFKITFAWLCTNGRT